MDAILQATRTPVAPHLLSRSRLADRAEFYAADWPRPPCDPIGLRGLPTSRDALDATVADLVSRIRSARERGVSGAHLAREMALSGPRAIRALVQYAQVYHRESRVIGMPGHGYYWGHSRPDLYRQVIAECRRRARSAFARASLLQFAGAPGLHQLVLDFLAPDPGPGEPADELSALLAADHSAPLPPHKTVPARPDGDL